MEKVLRNYLSVLAAPFASHHQNIPLTLSQAIAVSWIFVIAEAFYTILMVELGLQTAGLSLGGYPLPDHFDLVKTFNIIGFKLYLISSIFIVVIFPFFALGYVKVFTWIIGALLPLYGREWTDKAQEQANQALHYSLVANTFLIVPIFGQMIRNIAMPFYLYAGLRSNLGLRFSQALMIVASPLLVLLLLFASYILLIMLAFLL